MKKLMIAAAIVCAAAFAQAATVSWQIKLSSATKILDQTGNSWTKSGTANTAQTVYLMLAADTNTFVDHLKAGTLTSSDYLDSTSSGFTAATGAMSAAKVSPNDAKITTDAQAFNVVLVYKDGDGKDWYQISSATASSNARASEGDAAQVLFETGVVFAGSQTGWQAVSSGAAPEPTSGLLLLLGVAGLALKRKRA